MSPEDKFTLCRVMTTLFVGFLILPYFVLVRRIHIPFWFSNLLLCIMWLLVVAMERLRDKGMGNSPLFRNHHHCLRQYRHAAVFVDITRRIHQ